MTETYSLEDKISNIRKAIRNLTGDTFSNYHRDFQPTLLKRIDSDSSRNTQQSLENFLEEKYEEDRIRANSKSPLDCVTEHTFDYTKDDENISRTTFKYPSNKIITSFTSEDIKDVSSLKFNDGKENYELSVLLDHERENVRKLESRIMKKDEIISNMNTRQIYLTNEINDLKKKANDDMGIEEYKSLVSALQDKVDKYSSQIMFLQNTANKNLATPEFKLGSNEELQNKVYLLEKQNYELMDKCSEINTLNSKCKQTTQAINELSHTLELKEREIFDLVQENKEITSKLNEIQSIKKDSRQEFREFKLKEEITRLKEANQSLSSKISSKTHQKSAECLKPRKRSCSSHKTMSEITSILKCSTSDIITTLKKLKGSEKLEIRLEKLMKDLSPQNANLTPKHIWKCLRKVIEDYLAIKKRGETDIILNKLVTFVGVRQSDLYDEIKRICEEKKSMNSLVEKIKKMLCLSPHAAIREIEDTIDEKV